MEIRLVDYVSPLPLLLLLYNLPFVFAPFGRFAKYSADSIYWNGADFLLPTRWPRKVAFLYWFTVVRSKILETWLFLTDSLHDSHSWKSRDSVKTLHRRNCFDLPFISCTLQHISCTKFHKKPYILIIFIYYNIDAISSFKASLSINHLQIISSISCVSLALCSTHTVILTFEITCRTILYP